MLHQASPIARCKRLKAGDRRAGAWRGLEAPQPISCLCAAGTVLVSRERRPLHPPPLATLAAPRLFSFPRSSGGATKLIRSYSRRSCGGAERGPGQSLGARRGGRAAGSGEPGSAWAGRRGRAAAAALARPSAAAGRRGRDAAPARPGPPGPARHALGAAGGMVSPGRPLPAGTRQAASLLRLGSFLVLLLVPLPGAQAQQGE